MVGWEEAVFSTTIRGRLKLVHNGREYTKLRKTKNLTFWECCKKRSGCKGKAKTQTIDSKEMVKAYDLHNHDYLEIFNIKSEF